ncbi:MAG: hypothetical protein ACYST9_03815, partial [Planctomycetota bacterium]
MHKLCEFNQNVKYDGALRVLFVILFIAILVTKTHHLVPAIEVFLRHFSPEADWILTGHSFNGFAKFT